MKDVTYLGMDRAEYAATQAKALKRSAKANFASQQHAIQHLPVPDRATSTGDPLGDGASVQTYEWDMPGPFGDKPYILKLTVETIPVEKKTRKAA